MKSFEGSFRNLNFSLSTSILLNFFFPLVDIRCFFVKYKNFSTLEQSLNTSFSKATMVMRFLAKKNAGCLKAPRDFPPRKDGILYPVGLSWDSPPPPTESVRTEGRTDVRMYGRTDGRSRDYYVTTKISRIDRLPNFLSNGAPLAGFARRLRYNALSRCEPKWCKFPKLVICPTCDVFVAISPCVFSAPFLLR